MPIPELKKGVRGFIPGVPTPSPILPKPGPPIADILGMIALIQNEVKATMSMCDQLKDRVGHIGWRLNQIKSILEKYR